MTLANIYKIIVLLIYYQRDGCSAIEFSYHEITDVGEHYTRIVCAPAFLGSQNNVSRTPLSSYYYNLVRVYPCPYVRRVSTVAQHKTAILCVDVVIIIQRSVSARAGRRSKAQDVIINLTA